MKKSIILKGISFFTLALSIGSCGIIDRVNEKTHEHIMEHHDKVDSTCTQEGLESHFYCKGCGFYFNENLEKIQYRSLIIEMKDHDLEEKSGKAATCLENGYTSYQECKVCHQEFGKNVVPATDHNWSATYVWADDNSSVTATRICANDSSHNIVETVSTVPTVTQAQTCELPEITKYTATFTNEAFAVQTKENIQTKAALNHDYETTWSTSTTQHWHECKNANCDSTSGVENHSFEWTTNKGVSYKECSVCGYKRNIDKVEAHLRDREANELVLNTTSGLYEADVTFDAQWLSVYFTITFDDETSENITIANYSITGSIVPTKGSNTADERLYADQDNQVETGTYYYPLAGTTTYKTSFDAANGVLNLSAVMVPLKVVANVNNGNTFDLTKDTNTGLFTGKFGFTAIWQNVYFDVVFENGAKRRIKSANTTFSGDIKGGISSSGSKVLFADQNNQVETGTFYVSLDGENNYSATYDYANSTFSAKLEANVAKVVANVSSKTPVELTKNSTTGLFEGQIVFDEQWQNVYFVVTFSNDSSENITIANYNITGTIVPTKSSSATGTSELFADQDSQISTGTYYYSLTKETKYDVSFNQSSNTLSIEEVLDISKLVCYVSNSTSFDIIKNNNTGLFEGSFVVTAEWQSMYIDIVLADSSTKRIAKANTTFTGDIIAGISSCGWNKILYQDQSSQVTSGIFFYSGVPAPVTYNVSYNPATKTIDITQAQ